MGYIATVTTRLDPDVRDRLLTLASRHGRSLNEEVHAILVEAAQKVPATSIPPDTQPEHGLGTRISSLFAGTGYGLRPGEEFDMSGASWKIPDLDE